MASPAADERSTARRANDERIANEPRLAPRDLPSDAPAEPVEAHLGRHARRPVAVAGVVENGVVRPLDPAVKLTESSRVIIVTSQ